MKIIISLNNIKKNSKIAIYGTGETGREFYNLINNFRPDIKVLYFFDSFDKRKKYNNISIIKNIKQIQSLEKSLDYIVVCSIFWDEINNYLNKYNIKKNYILSNFIINKGSHINSFGDFYFNPKKISSLKKKYYRIIKNFSDSLSKKIYKECFALRVYKKEESFFKFIINFNCKYRFFFKDNYLKSLHLKKINYAIEAGGYDGKESSKLLMHLKKNKNFKKLFVFEPNLKLFKEGKYYNKMNKNYFSLYENILGNKDKLSKFYINSNSPGSSCVQRSSSFNKQQKNINAIRIDSFLKKHQVSADFLRLDVEGSEIQVLKGAKQSIIKYKPQIQISVYHKKEDLLDIPGYLLSLNNNYRFKILPGSSTFVDMVLFAY